MFNCAGTRENEGKKRFLFPKWEKSPDGGRFSGWKIKYFGCIGGFTSLAAALQYTLRGQHI
jgi:hypothetical protein